MALSKPIFHLLGSYLQNLYLNPIRTKSITSGVLAALANYSSQVFNGENKINHNSIIAFGTFGFLFGGTLPHFFYSFLDRFLPNNGPWGLFKQLMFERLIYTPLFQAFFLFITSRLEGNNNKTALNNVERLIEKAVRANWKYLTIFQIINLAFVPPVLRVLFANMVGFAWGMYMAYIRNEEAKKVSRKRQKEAEKRN